MEKYIFCEISQKFIINSIRLHVQIITNLLWKKKNRKLSMIKFMFKKSSKQTRILHNEKTKTHIKPRKYFGKVKYLNQQCLKCLSSKINRKPKELKISILHKDLLADS